MTAVMGRRPPPARTELSVADKAWVAGVFDLKLLVIRKNNKTRATPQLVLAVETKNEEIVRGLSALTGTRPEVQRAKDTPGFMRKGCDEHCPHPHVHVNDRGYAWSMPAVARWTITGAAAAVVLFNLLPYMRRPRNLPELMDEMFDYTRLHGQGWGATRASLQRLMKLGWAMPKPFEELV